MLGQVSLAESLRAVPCAPQSECDHLHEAKIITQLQYDTTIRPFPKCRSAFGEYLKRTQNLRSCHSITLLCKAA